MEYRNLGRTGLKVRGILKVAAVDVATIAAPRCTRARQQAACSQQHSAARLCAHKHTTHNERHPPTHTHTQVSALSFGSWVTMSYQVQAVRQAAELLAACREAGCNFFDNAEVYAKGEAEALIGKAMKVGPRRAMRCARLRGWMCIDGGDGRAWRRREGGLCSRRDHMYNKNT